MEEQQSEVEQVSVSDEPASDEPDSRGPGPDEQPPDEHRGFVREMNSAFSSVYGYGGAAVLAALGAVVAIGWQLGALTSPLLWILAVVTFLGSLFVLRLFVRRRAQRQLERIRQYCEVNEISAETLREQYGHNGLYPYFDSIFEVVERQREIRDGGGV